MYREHAGPSAPSPWAAADQNAKTIGWIQIGCVGMQLFSLLIVVLQFGAGKQLSFMDVETKATILLVSFATLVAMGAWAALNAWGMRRRSRLAHVSSILFAIAQILTCFGWVFGAGLLVLLFKKEMKGYYDKRVDE